MVLPPVFQGIFVIFLPPTVLGMLVILLKKFVFAMLNFKKSLTVIKIFLVTRLILIEQLFHPLNSLVQCSNAIIIDALINRPMFTNNRLNFLFIDRFFAKKFILEFLQPLHLQLLLFFYVRFQLVLVNV